MPDQNTPYDADADDLVATMARYDERVVELSFDDEATVSSVRRSARGLAIAIVDAVPQSVERAIALQKVREAYLWVADEVAALAPQPIVSTTEQSA
jgi:hypothetical protein